MKILSAEQIRKADSFTIEHEPISSIDLMERASTAFVEWFISRFSPKCQVGIVCGTGNNGGDGLAIARLLKQKKYHIEVFVIKKDDSASMDCQINEERVKGLLEVNIINVKTFIPDLSKYDILIDAIFGSGLTRKVEGLHAEVIDAINNVGKTVVAVDIASGLFSDSHSFPGTVVKVDYTVSFQQPKLAFFMPENFDYVGDWHVLDIGLRQEAIEQQETPYFMLDAKLVRPLLKIRQKFSHKGTHGKALIMAGSYGKMGAAVLSAKAALRTGVGLLTMNIPSCGYGIMQSSVPEAMVIVDEGDHYLTSYADTSAFDAVGIGPGIGKEQETVYSLIQSLQTFGKPVVIDADGLNIIAEHQDTLQALPKNSILTPHPKEFERLVGTWSDDFQRMEKQKAFSKEHKVIVVLKGAHTAVSLPTGEVYFNSSGNPGMATGGTGDVLTGILTSLLAQKYSPQEAAKLGVYLHGLAGDFAAGAIGEVGIIASDVIDFIPDAYLHLYDLPLH